jgi:hypothetical protein
MYKLVLPSWTYSLPNKTQITAKEVSSFFGFATVSSLHRIVASGKFPKHEFASFKNCNRGKSTVFHWSLKCLRNYVIEQNKANKQ